MTTEPKNRQLLVMGVVLMVLLLAGVVLMKDRQSSGQVAQDAAGTIAPAARYRADKSAGVSAPVPVTDANAPSTPAGPQVDQSANAANAAKASAAANAADGIPSDLRLKRDVHRRLTLPNGMKIYSFKYRWSDQTYLGVMAQDLLARPAWRGAVVTRPDGYYAVNYAKLGLKMATWQEWQSKGISAIQATP